jgi:hypothetical protein
MFRKRGHLLTSEHALSAIVSRPAIAGNLSIFRFVTTLDGATDLLVENTASATSYHFANLWAEISRRCQLNMVRSVIMSALKLTLLSMTTG